ncbi:MAG: hypothetical protein U0R49_02965 [Fimbriimonadales bacterium]
MGHFVMLHFDGTPSRSYCQSASGTKNASGQTQKDITGYTYPMKAIALSAIFLAAVSHTAPTTSADETAKRAFDKMKTLVGKWEGKMGEGADAMPATVEYKLTGSGSALVETLGPGSPFEMVSVYHMDGDNLVMTHYCGAGNQPSMKFKPAKDANVLFFDFVKGSNMKPTDMHMHNVAFTFDGADHVTAVWQAYNNNKPAEKAVFDFKRVK